MRRKPNRRNWRPAAEQLESRAVLSTFTVTTAETYGPGSLRVAIAKANETPRADVINFQIPGDGVHFIKVPAEGLPRITGKVIIDGYTQPGSARNTSADPAANNAKVTVNLVWGGSSKGLTSLLSVFLRGDGTQIRGLGFYDSGSTTAISGVAINRANFVTVDGNVFGATGRTKLNAAVVISGGSHNTIGGDVAGTPALQNVMSGYVTGVELAGPATNNAVVGNLIGRQPVESEFPSQRVGVGLRPGANNNAVVKNVLYKNIEPVRVESTGNWIADNVVVPRVS